MRTMVAKRRQVNESPRRKVHPCKRKEGPTKLINGSRVGQVGTVDSCGQVRDLDSSLVNSRNLSRVGQVRPVDSCGQVGNIDPSGSK